MIRSSKRRGWLVTFEDEFLASNEDIGEGLEKGFEIFDG